MISETERIVNATLVAKPFYRPEMGPVLVAVLDKFCQSDDHRRRVCEKAILMRFGPEDRQEDRCPGPAELAELCAQVPASVGRQASPDCEICVGTGWKITSLGLIRCPCGGFPPPSGQHAPIRDSGGVTTADEELNELVSNLSQQKRF